MNDTFTPALARRVIRSAKVNGDLVADDVMLACRLAVLYKRPVTIEEAHLVSITMGAESTERRAK